MVVKITRANRAFFVTTHCSLLSHITERYKQQKPCRKAAPRALGSGDLTSSLAPSSCRMTPFLEHHVRTAPVNLYISIRSREPSMVFGTASSPEAFCVHIDVTQEDAGRAGPICDEKQRVL